MLKKIELHIFYLFQFFYRPDRPRDEKHDLYFWPYTKKYSNKDHCELVRCKVFLIYKLHVITSLCTKYILENDLALYIITVVKMNQISSADFSQLAGTSIIIRLMAKIMTLTLLG